MVILYLIFLVPLTLGEYHKAGYGQFCSDSSTRIRNRYDCEVAAAALGLAWGKSWWGPYDFPGCLHTRDSRNKVYFNESPHPTTNPNSHPKMANYAEICTGKDPDNHDGLVKEPVPTEAWLTQCGDLMKSENVFENFSEAVSHGVHSLTLQDLRAFFKEEAIIANGIHTANRNLKAADEEIILPNAPDIPGIFNSIGMHTLDIALQNMDRPNYEMKTGILARLSHTYHMQEYWTAAQPFYQQYKTSGVDSNVCACALDTEGNGIDQGLINIFVKFAKSQFINPIGPHCLLFNIYGHYSLEKKENCPLPTLTNSKTWDIWRNLISTTSMPGDDDIKKFALFMYCALA